MDEIAGDYSDSMVRLGERVLSWLWNRLYNGIIVNNADRLRKLAEDGRKLFTYLAIAAIWIIYY